MPKFVVHICEGITYERSRVIEARDADEAERLASLDDWQTWHEDDVQTQAYIDWVEEADAD